MDKICSIVGLFPVFFHELEGWPVQPSRGADRSSYINSIPESYVDRRFDAEERVHLQSQSALFQGKFTSGDLSSDRWERPSDNHERVETAWKDS